MLPPLPLRLPLDDVWCDERVRSLELMCFAELDFLPGVPSAAAAAASGAAGSGASPMTESKRMRRRPAESVPLAESSAGFGASLVSFFASATGAAAAGAVAGTSFGAL